MANDTGRARGIQPISASLAGLLAHRGIRSGITGDPLTEATILGIGGGLGAGYILWEFKARGGAVLTLGFGNRWQYPGDPGWTGTTLERLGLGRQVIETSGAVSAGRTLDDALDAGEPVVVHVDQQAIGTWAQPAELSGMWGYPVLVTGRAEDGRYLVDDRGRAPLLVPREVMAASRARIVSSKHRLVRVADRDVDLSADRIRAAVRIGLEDQVEHLRQPSDSFSLPAWRRWSRLLTDGRHAKGWPRVFADGRRLFAALLSIVEEVDGEVGASGGHLRFLYADSLDEAAAMLDEPRLADAATHWRAAGDLWEDLAVAAVPADMPGGSEAIDAAERLHAAVMDGEPGRDRVRSASEDLWRIREAQAGALDLTPDRLEALFADLAQRLAEIYDAERGALESTAAAIDR